MSSASYSSAELQCGSRPLLLGTTEDNVVRRTKDGIHGSSLVHH